MLVDKAPPQVQRAYTGAVLPEGGAAFQRDTSAGGNITINHFNRIPLLARDLYRSCSESSDFFHQVRSELASLLVAAETTEEYARKLSFDAERDARLDTFSQDCLALLEDLKRLKADFDGAGSQSQMTWERLGWRADELSDIRLKLISHNSLLNTINSGIISSSQHRVEILLHRYIEELRSGRREGSVLSGQSSASLSLDEEELWQHIRRELVDVGITSAVFTEHRPYIINTLRRAMEEEFRDGVSSSDDPSGLAKEFSRVGPTNNTLDKPSKKKSRTVSSKHSSSSGSKLLTVFKSLSLSFLTKDALLRAALSGDLEKVQKLVNKGLDPTRPDDNFGLTPLMMAARKGRQDVVQFLLQKGVNVNVENRSGETALDMAASNGHEIVVSLLLEKGADLEGNDRGQTPLVAAAQNGHKRVVSFLLEKGVNVNKQDAYGNTPLVVAARNGYNGIVRLLLDKGADVNKKDGNGQSALHMAAENGYEGMVRIILTKEPDVNNRDGIGTTALFRAMQHCQENVAWLLLDKGFDVNEEDESGKTLLHLAAERGLTELLKNLLKQGTMINKQDDCGRTPLALAAQCRQSGTINALLQHHADYLIKDNKGRTAMHMAGPYDYELFRATIYG